MFLIQSKYIKFIASLIYLHIALKMCDIAKLTNELKILNDNWKTLRQQLGLKQAALEQVELNRKYVADMKTDMIDRWETRRILGRCGVSNELYG